MRKLLILVLGAVLIIAIVGGYFGWAYYVNQPQKNNTVTLPVDQIRDRALAYIVANHTETAQLMQNLSWSGGQQASGLLGSETYQYKNGNWSVTIQYPVTLNPIYTITANCSSVNTNVNWVGTWQNGILKETSVTINVPSVVLSTQEQVREVAMAYIKGYHNQTGSLMQDLSWTGGRLTSQSSVGAETYSYQSSGWNVTIQYPVVPKPTYTITATCMLPTQAISSPYAVSWQGTLQNGVVVETNFKSTI